MSKTESSQFLALLGLLALVSGDFISPSGATTQSTNRIVMTIEQLDNRITKPSSTSEGILKLKFVNAGDDKTVLYFVGSLSFSGGAILIKQDLTPTQSLFFHSPDGFSSVGAAISTVNYEWRNNEVVVERGSYDVSQPPQSLDRNGHCYIYVPIHLPSTPGPYQLSVHFSNLPLLDVLHSRGSSDPSDWAGCVETIAQASISIPVTTKPPVDRTK